MVDISIGVAINSVIGWITRKVVGDDRIKIRSEIKYGPISREYGATETAIEVTVVNNSPINVEIYSVRLMIDKKFGVPLPDQAPVPRQHDQLPKRIKSGLSRTWYFGTERTSLFVLTFYPAIGEKWALRPRVETVAGDVYKGDEIEFLTDANAYSPV